MLPVIALYLYIQTAYQEAASVGEPATTEEVSDETITAEANLSTVSFNRLVSAVIGGDDVPSQLTVDDQVSFAGTIDALGTKVAYTMQGQPSVMEDGNIDIDVTNIELAGLQLPTSTVLAIFQLTLPTDLPLQVLSGEEQIIIRDRGGQTIRMCSPISEENNELNQSQLTNELRKNDVLGLLNGPSSIELLARNNEGIVLTTDENGVTALNISVSKIVTSVPIQVYNADETEDNTNG